MISVDDYGLKPIIMHYGTIVLEIGNGEVIIRSAKTASSKRVANLLMNSNVGRFKKSLLFQGSLHQHLLTNIQTCAIMTMKVGGTNI